MFNNLFRCPFQFSLPQTSLEMATVEKLLHIPEDSVPCKIRAKRGCATHPRSIAERVSKHWRDIIIIHIMPNYKIFYWVLFPCCFGALSGKKYEIIVINSALIHLYITIPNKWGVLWELILVVKRKITIARNIKVSDTVNNVKGLNVMVGLPLKINCSEME